MFVEEDSKLRIGTLRVTPSAKKKLPRTVKGLSEPAESVGVFDPSCQLKSLHEEGSSIVSTPPSGKELDVMFTLSSGPGANLHSCDSQYSLGCGKTDEITLIKCVILVW